MPFAVLYTDIFESMVLQHPILCLGSSVGLSIRAYCSSSNSNSDSDGMGSSWMPTYYIFILIIIL